MPAFEFCYYERHGQNFKFFPAVFSHFARFFRPNRSSNYCESRCEAGCVGNARPTALLARDSFAVVLDPPPPTPGLLNRFRVSETLIGSKQLFGQSVF